MYGAVQRIPSAKNSKNNMALSLLTKREFRLNA
jgi:hypothetical protein